MQVCVYCASSGQIHSDYFEATAKMAKDFAENGVSVVFGGGSSGLIPNNMYNVIYILYL